MSSLQVLGSLAGLFVALEAFDCAIHSRLVDRLLGRITNALREAFEEND